MSDHCLPLIPRIILGVLDPLAVALTSFSAIADPAKYYHGLVPSTSLSPIAVDGHAKAVAILIAALMFAISASQIIGVWSNKSASVIIWIMLSQFAADMIYMYGTYVGVGPDYFWDSTQWDSKMWGLMITDWLFNITRILTVFGVFGPLGSQKAKRQ